MQTLLPIHIVAGGLALVVGTLALLAAKGGKLHRRAGLAFVVAMLIMASSATVMAVVQSKSGSVVAGLLATYLVATALLTVRPGPRWLTGVLMLIACATGVVSVFWGVDAVLHDGQRDGVPAIIFFVFGLVALAASSSDLRLLGAARLVGRRRLARHLWRMCFALWIASASFFLGQARVIPEPLRILPLLFVLAFLPLVALVYWLWRVRSSAGFVQRAVRFDATFR